MQAALCMLYSFSDILLLKMLELLSSMLANLAIVSTSGPSSVAIAGLQTATRFA